MMKKINMIFILFTFLLLSSCANSIDVDSIQYGDKIINTDSVLSKESEKELMRSFSCILSKAVYNSKDLREFIKTEASKQFDLNNEFLYYPNRERMINGKETLREILVSYSSEGIIKEVERRLPLLNCLIPDLPMVGVSPSDLNVDNKELPVVVGGDEDGTDLYVDGKKLAHLNPDEVPGVNVIVVNLNRRLKAVPGTKACDNWVYEFKYPNFDNKNQKITRATLGFDHSVMPSYLYKKAIAAFDAGFNKDDNSNNQIAYQRDNIYYGITPSNQQGALNRSVTEYLSYMMVDKSAYFKISDQNANLSNDDPMIKNSSTSEKKHALTDDELYSRLWKDGNYTFVFDVASSNSATVTKLPVNISPRDLWDFNIDLSRKHSTLFRHSVYTYTIKPEDFTSKKYYFNPDDVTFGKWNIAEEGLTRYISIYEEDDKGVSESKEFESDFTKIKESQFNGELKLSLGIGKDTKLDGGASETTKNSTTTTIKHKYTIQRNEADDMLGENIPIYFYDPIVISEQKAQQGSSYGHFGRRISGKKEDTQAGSFAVYNHVYKQYNSGSVVFAIDVR